MDWIQAAADLKFKQNIPWAKMSDALYEKTGVKIDNGKIRDRLRWTKEYKEWQGKEIDTKEGEEEKLPPIQDCGDYYVITSGKRSIQITKAKYKELKLLYCDDNPLNINELCRKLDIPRRDFYLIKTAFNITHKDVPYIDEELTDDNIDNLVDETLERRKDKYFVKLQQQEIESLKKEVEQYRQQDYMLNKLIEGLNIPKDPITFKSRVYIPSEREGQLNIADWHTGLKTLSRWNEFNLDILRQRVDELVSKTIYYGKQNNIKKLHVLNLGDMIHGLIHESTRIVSECDTGEQVTIVWKLIASVLKEFAGEFQEIEYYDTYGNHARFTPKKEDALDKENFEMLTKTFLRADLQNIPNIKINDNEYDDQIIVTRIAGHLIFGSHGDRDNTKQAAKNLTMMINQRNPYKVFLAHKHHMESMEVHGVDTIISRSLCGIDEHAKDIRATSKPGQTLYIYNAEGLECTYDINFK